MSRKAVIIIVSVATVLVLGLLLLACAKKAPTTPAPNPTVQVVEDDDSCLSMEELIERDEDCGYAPTSKKPAVKPTVKDTPKKPVPRRTR